MEKNKFLAFISIFAVVFIFFSFVLTSYADNVEPSLSDGTVTIFPSGLTSEYCTNLRNLWLYQNSLSTIVGNIRRYTVMIMYQIQVSGGYQYYVVALSPNRFGNSSYNVTFNSSTSFSLNGTGAWLQFGFVDNNNTGWKYIGNATQTINHSGYIYYRTNTVNNSYDEFTTNTTHIGTNTFTGSAYERYKAAYTAFSNPDGIIDTDSYNAGKAAGIIIGRNDVISDPGGFNLFTYAEYTSNFTAGQNSVLINPNRYNLYTSQQYQQALQGGSGSGGSPAVVDLENVLLSIPNAAKDILLGIIPEEPTVFGISFLSLAAAILISVFTIWFVKKVK